MASNDLAAKREAFLAAEHARRAAADPGHVDTGYVDSGYVETPAARSSYRPDVPTKSLLLAYVLWFFACGISAHRFYLGAYQSAFAQLGCFVGGGILIGFGASTHLGPSGMVGILAIGFGILWMLADVFLLPGVHRRMRERSQPSALGNVFA